MVGVPPVRSGTASRARAGAVARPVCLRRTLHQAAGFDPTRGGVGPVAVHAQRALLLSEGLEGTSPAGARFRGGVDENAGWIGRHLEARTPSYAAPACAVGAGQGRRVNGRDRYANREVRVRHPRTAAILLARDALRLGGWHPASSQWYRLTRAREGVCGCLRSHTPLPLESAYRSIPISLPGDDHRAPQQNTNDPRAAWAA